MGSPVVSSPRAQSAWDRNDCQFWYEHLAHKGPQNDRDAMLPVRYHSPSEFLPSDLQNPQDQGHQESLEEPELEPELELEHPKWEEDEVERNVLRLRDYLESLNTNNAAS